MEETIGFICDAYRQQGKWRTVDLGITTEIVVSSVEEKACVLTMEIETRKMLYGSSELSSRQRTRFYLFLADTDPLSLEVNNDLVVVNKSSSIKDQLSFPASASEAINLGTKDAFQGGFISRASSQEIVFASDDGKNYRLKLPAKDLPLKESQGIPSLSPTEARAGDRILLWGRNKISIQPGIWIAHPRQDFSPPAELTRFTMPPLQDAEMGPRVAKALLHAIVLCQHERKTPAF